MENKLVTQTDSRSNMRKMYAQAMHDQKNEMENKQPKETLEEAAIVHATKEWVGTGLNKIEKAACIGQSMMDFEAGANWQISQQR